MVLLIGVINEVKGSQRSQEGFTAMMHWDNILVRIICGYLMHMRSEPEVR
jgi:hypothetical protein